jgi:3-hydroxybutyryl-CoA dehydrogenase
MSRMKIAIIGAGRMGKAIAYIFASHGHQVALHDTNPDSLSRLPAEFERIAGLCHEARPDLPSSYSTLPEALVDVDFVLEAVAENLETKKEVFRTVSRFAPRSALLATNSSSITVSELAYSVQHPSRLLGTHFWNPPYAVPLVEVSQSPKTDEDCAVRAVDLLRNVGMQPVRIMRDIPGLVGNRLQHAMKREAIALVAAGVCDAETVDTVAKLGFGSRLAVLGPLEQSDMVGLDLTLEIHRALMPSLDNSVAPQALLIEKVAEGHTGMDAGAGFRTWTKESADEVRHRLDAHVVALAVATRQSVGAEPGTDGRRC